MRKQIIPIVFGGVFFSWLFSIDFASFSLPRLPVLHLYVYTALFLFIGLLIIAYLHSLDRKYTDKEPDLRNALRIVLGGLWIMDGILQMQPQMPFGFSHFVIEPSLQSLPLLILNPLSGLPALWNSHSILFDAIASAVQLFLGIALIILRSAGSVRKVAVLSLFWAIFVWILAEGMGDIFQPGLSLLSGFPGAAFLYATLSALLLSRRDDRAITAFLRALFISLFMVGAVLQALPWEGFWTGSGISSIPGGFIISKQPIILASAILYVAKIMDAGMVMWNAVFTIIFVMMGLLWLTRPRVAAAVTMAVMPVFWFIGQDFGVFGMYGTDPNTGLPLILLSMVYMLFGAGLLAKPQDRETRSVEADTA